MVHDIVCLVTIVIDIKGYVPGTSETSIPGVVACGDVKDNKYRQAYGGG
jgi:thioredoxin reductase